MIRAAALEAAVAVLTVEDCPTCGGNGVVVVERLFGRNAPEPYLTRTCNPCHGTGMVPGEWVEYCAQPGCTERFWTGEGCTHMPDSPLCPDHRPANCRDCVDERSDR